MIKKCSFVFIFSSILFIKNEDVFAKTLKIQSGVSVTVQVDKTYGATIELPSAVHIATPPKIAKVEPLSGNAVNDGSENAQSNDVRVFQIYPFSSKKTQVQDRMTFLLWDGKTVSVHLVSSDNNPDNFYQIQFQKTESDRSKYASNSKYFLSDEKKLMIKMLKDEIDVDRNVVNYSVVIDKYPELSIKIVRVFKQDGLIGYTLTATNTTDKKVVLNPTIITIGGPNNVAMIQTDHEELQSCSENSDTNPRGTGCMTALRLVLRDSFPGSMEQLGMDTLDEKKTPFSLTQVATSK